MSSEAITRNDLTAILNEVLPPTPSEYRKLLWTNPSPTSSFAAQTVSIDLSDYDEVEVYYRRSTANAATFSEKYKIGELGLGYYISGTTVGDRTSTISTSGIDFGAGWSSNTQHNDYIVPIYIYGIKYERVYPPQDISGYVVVENVSLGSISKNGSAYEKTNCDVSASIPSGYKLATALFCGTGSYQVYCYECRKASDTTVVFRGYLGTGTAPASITPKATLICEKA